MATAKNQPPKWATKILNKAWDEFGSGPRPTLTWRQSRVKPHTSGHAYGGLPPRIVVTAGTDPFDLEYKVVLLHEIAHHLTGFRHGHDYQFHVTCWELFRFFKLPVRKVHEVYGHHNRGNSKKARLATAPKKGGWISHNTDGTYTQWDELTFEVVG